MGSGGCAGGVVPASGAPPQIANAIAGEECRFYHADEASVAWRQENTKKKRKEQDPRPSASAIADHHERAKRAAPERSGKSEVRS